MKKVIVILLLVYLTDSHSVTVVKLNKELNVLEFAHSIEVLNQKSKKECQNCCKVFTPLAPYENISCVVTAPRTVFVGFPFTIDYAINIHTTTYISFWADLLPSYEQMNVQGLKLIHYTSPSIGEFDEYAESTINKGGRGIWRFDNALPAGTYHMSFTFVAHDVGMKSFTTLLATNPPSYITMMEINAISEDPLVQNDYAQGYDNQPILIPVLDNDTGHSSLSIKQVSKPKHGKVIINPDHSLTYTSVPEFEGIDNFVYVAQDVAGNSAQGLVEVKICKCPVAQIVS